MHDPKTVAFDIPNPFARRYSWAQQWSQRPALVTIWHVDPEKRGDDDSCGFTFANLSEADQAWAKKLADGEWPFWFSREYEQINFAGVSDLAILATVWLAVRHQVKRTPQNRALSAWDMAQVFRLMTCPGDNFGHLVADARENAEGLERLLLLTLRAYRTAVRPWWQRPRWHVHHWQIQVHPWQQFCRWAWSRCQSCGKRFRWGYSPVSGSWHGTGPRFLRGEPNVFHHECHGKVRQG
jgi:hypothetical protein